MAKTQSVALAFFALAEGRCCDAKSVSAKHDNYRIKNGPTWVQNGWQDLRIDPGHAAALSQSLGLVPRPKIYQQDQSVACLCSRAGVIQIGHSGLTRWLDSCLVKFRLNNSQSHSSLGCAFSATQGRVTSET